MFMSFGGGFGFGGVPQILSNDDVQCAFDALPDNIKSIFNKYNISKSYISCMSGLIQTEPIFRSYDLLKKERKILIDFAYDGMNKMLEDEKNLLSEIKKYSDNKRFYFMQFQVSLEMWITTHEKELKTIKEDLKNINYEV